jgi:ferric-dicitrate binding protein FerR (iron transport regulator)
MKSNRSLSKIAATVLAAEARPAAEVAPDARANTIRAITGAMRARKRQRRMRWYAMGAVAACAAAVVGLGVGRAKSPQGAEPVATRSAPAMAASFVRGAPEVVRQGVRRPLSDGTSLDVGDRVVVEPGSRATVALAQKTYLAIDDHAELILAIAAPATTFELGAGSVRADVAKLSPNERFVIRTGDAEVEVRGTSFEVSVVDPDPACGSGTRTRVKVREGTVAVRARGSESLVSAGGSWPSGCTAAQGALMNVTGASPSEPPPSSDARGSESARGPSIRSPSASGAAGAGGPDIVRTWEPRGENARAARGEAPASSDLPKENDLYERALAKKRAGDPRGSVALLDDLVAHYPNGPLAQSARAERMKLLRGVDNERARESARDYVKRHPNGFARQDADLILSAH